MLTYMATLEDALAQIAETYELPGWEARQTVNQLWVTTSFWQSFDATDALHDEKIKLGGRTIGEHIEQGLRDFRCSERPGAGDLRRLLPNKYGVWKIHVPGARIYGWCPRARAFVAVGFAIEADTKTDKKLNDTKRDEVLSFIKTHKLDRSVIRGDILAIFPPKPKS
ncbi:hypothetical protein [Bradyrhizobium elkanii]|uniref:hypothetical protein n=1 Tax=Bradyrhizobium elkanii TaxID=29448 RepID=UPI002226743B|nr:hypothetical protein [Bradyrhizobium elkanii]MCW2227220.1 hypothetical protein [Bradyrhizobium elkanii]